MSIVFCASSLSSRWIKLPSITIHGNTSLTLFVPIRPMQLATVESKFTASIRIDRAHTPTCHGRRRLYDDERYLRNQSVIIQQK